MIASSRVVIVLAGMLTTAVVPAAAAQAPAVPPGAPAPGAADPARLPSRPATPGGVPSPGAPPRDASARRPPETGTAVVRGRVIALDTGLPVRRARVSLFGAGQPRVSTTDADGVFLFERLPASRYQLRASKPRYIDTAHGARRPGGPGRPLEVTDGQSVEDVVLALQPAGVIAGRVVDDVGEPVAGARVQPMRYRTLNGERQLATAGMPRTTDDTGAFRLYGLAPGKYYLSAAAEGSQRFYSDSVDVDATGFAPTYYPGTPVAAEAQPIEVGAGTETMVDVQLALARLSTVTGIVVNAEGVPATGGSIMVSSGTRSGGMISSSTGAMIKPDGTFRLQGLAPGEYWIGAHPSFGDASLFESSYAGRDTPTANAAIVVTGEPISGLRLIVQPRISIPVSVTFEDAAAERPERVFVTANAERGPNSGRATMTDGRLVLEVTPGTYRLSAGVMATGPGRRWFPKRIVYRGEDVSYAEAELTAEPGGRIHVVLTTRTSTLVGGVKDASGRPAVDCRVILIPEDGERRRRLDADGGLRLVTGDEQGRFRVEHIRPGRYLAAAIPDEPIEDVYDLDFLEGIRRAGTPVDIVEGGTATLSLTLATLP